MQLTINLQQRTSTLSVLVRYGIAVSATSLAFFCTLLLLPLIQTSFFPFFSLAVLVSAWVGGLGPGLLAAALAALANAYFLLPPYYTLAVTADGLLKLSFFTLVAVCISVLANRRKQAEEAERAQREYLQVTLASIGDAVIVTGPAGAVTFLNRVAEKLTGWTSVEAKGKPLSRVFNIVNEETRKPVEDPVVKVLRTGEVAGLANHTILLAKDGREYPIDDSAAPIRDAKGHLLGIVLVFRDISDHKQAELALAESERRWRTLAETLPALVWMARPDGFLDYYSQRWYDYTGMTAEQLAGWGWEAVWHPEDLPAGRARWLEALRVGEPYEYEARFRCAADHSHRWQLIRAVPLRDAEGKVVRWFGSNMDIEEQKRTELALRESEIKFATAFQLNPLPMALITLDGRVVEANDAVEHSLGYSRAELLGHTTVELGMYADLQRRAAFYHLLRHEGRVREFEAVWVTKSGAQRTMLMSAEPLTVHGERYLLVVNNDITARKQAEAERERLVSELQRINAEFQQFSYIVSHDLNEPLRTMHSYIQLIARETRGKLDAATAEDMAFVVDAAQRMQQMLTDLLAYTRAGQTPQFQSVDCEAVLTQVLTALQVQISDCGARIIHDPLPTVCGDATRLGQVFQNLIGNALKFCEAHPPHIHITAVRETQHWRVSVRDNGIGIDPQQSGQLFQVFQRLHTLGEYPGTGIGLAICKRIVEQHGGRIWVESKPREGSTFYFTIRDKRARPTF